eukprot:CAMPEP_0182868072 /NCGR_PEP_ID=MMETSP0034_2-20130328/9100_1 /TAXON_ID=156128 /ORGANISM="Nephroselmis pyriformis, Strain CCMP717" /LENGTH=117 /DNA_ID=CAMNT_0025000461 /DNA_START=172 /DNA_END=521 /DNA_ORIENTATION=-
MVLADAEASFRSEVEDEIPEELPDPSGKSHLPYRAYSNTYSDRAFSDVPTGGRALARRIADGRCKRFPIPVEDDGRQRIIEGESAMGDGFIVTKRGHKASHIMRPQANLDAPSSPNR